MPSNPICSPPVSWRSLVVLAQLTAVFLAHPPAHAQTTVVDSNPVNCPQIRDSYMSRHPFCAQNERRHTRAAWTDYPHEPFAVLGQQTTEHDTTVVIPNTAVYMTKAAPPQSGDVRAMNVRPQYRAVASPSGHYVQPQQCFDNKNNLASAQDEEIFDNEATTFGLPMSDTQFQVIDRLDNQRFLELLFDPERWMWTGQAMAEVQREGMSNALAAGSEAAFASAVNEMEDSLANVANEQAGQPCSTTSATRSLSQAIWMVQKCFKQIYLPIAMLFILPGALLTHIKGVVSTGILSCQSADTSSPLIGILRAVIAVILVPTTQLITSYTIDIGNALSLEVKHFVNNESLIRWSHEQTYNAPPRNYDNTMTPTKFSCNADPALQRMEAPTSIGGQASTPQKYWTGKGSEMGPEELADGSHSTNLSQVLQLVINCVSFLMASALAVLTSFQTATICYLFLLGPIAAALFAWPSGIGNSASGLFKQVFASWLNGLIVLSLWRFWWVVVLSCMCVRIECLKDMGIYTPNTQWEASIFMCFLALLLYVPFQPFNFSAGDVAAKVLDQVPKDWHHVK